MTTPRQPLRRVRLPWQPVDSTAVYTYLFAVVYYTYIYLYIEVGEESAEDAPVTKCTVCAKQLRGMWRTSGQGLCQSCQPAKCTEEGCGKRLLKAWRFVGKCCAHGGYEGLPK